MHAIGRSAVGTCDDDMECDGVEVLLLVINKSMAGGGWRYGSTGGCLPRAVLG